MRRRLFTILTVLALLITPAVASVTYSVVGVGSTRPVMVNGEQMTFPDVEPMSYEGRTLLPVRAVAEALGVDIDYIDGSVIINTIDTEKLKEACVEIYCENTTNWSQGSGVYIDYGEILTCYHVVDGMTSYEIDDEYSASFADAAESQDAAVLKVDTDIKPVKIGDSDEIDVGDKVYIISAPDGEADTVTSGEVLYWADIYNECSSFWGFITSADTEAGSSGGACFNSKGELIGIVNGGDGDESSIIPINDVRKALAA